MKLLPKVAVAAILAGAAQASMGAACLTNPSDTVGNFAAFGATVQTFINLGINPNTTCIENGKWTAPQGFVFGSYVKGADGWGTGIDNTVLNSYNGAGSAAANANALDHAWVQDTGSGRPQDGIVWDLGGQANQLAVFVFVDHGPVPGEVLENTAYLSNNPNALDAGWTQAKLIHVYGAGWADDPIITDGFVAVYQLPNAATFRYASVAWGGPGAVVRDGDNEIDAVGGLSVAGCGVNDTRPECQRTNVPEPDVLGLLGIGLGALAWAATRRQRRA